VPAEEIAEHLRNMRPKIAERFPGVSLTDEAIDFLSTRTDGDVRFALSVLEQCLAIKGEGDLTAEDIAEGAGKLLAYDRNGENHYDNISAMHKSLRDSEGDAAIYYIGRMLAGGEDPRYIARRMINFAAEDVGIGDPQALVLANATYDVCEKMGMPEAELPLCELAYYLAAAPRDNRVYVAMKKMQQDVRDHGNLPIPMHLRNAPTGLMEELGYGKGYEYAHNLPNKKSSQEHFPKGLEGRKYLEG
jgi:putative ATPase